MDVLGRIVPNIRERLSVENVSTFAALSPDGTRIVTATEGAAARIWDAASGAPLATLAGHEAQVNFAAFSPDGITATGDRTAITASPDHSARVWDALSGQETAALRGHEAQVNFAAFSPDGKLVVTASADRTARIWDAVSGRDLAVLRGHAGFVNTAVFSPDGTRIVTASNDDTQEFGTWPPANRSRFLRDIRTG